MFTEYLKTQQILQTPGRGAAPWVIAHRGYSGVAPENTLAAVDAARATGADLIEVDAWISGDGTPVIIHDGTLGRTTGSQGNVVHMSDERIFLADAGIWMGRGFAGQRVPTLEGLLGDLSVHGGDLLLELKGEWSAGAVARISQEIMDFGMADRTIVQSFSVSSLQTARDMMPMVPRGLLRMTPKSGDAQLAQDLQAIAVNVSVKGFSNHRDLVDDFLASDLACCVFTANRPDEWARLLAAGVTGIITDHPGRLQGFLAAREHLS
jgi:glycerophosphoryl diester phosphodiesterase